MEAARREPIDEEHAVRVTLRHAGRTYGVIAYPSGSSTIDVDGRFHCKADWNGRVLDTGLNEVHPDRDVSYEILLHLGEGLQAVADEEPGTPAPASE